MERLSQYRISVLCMKFSNLEKVTASNGGFFRRAHVKKALFQDVFIDILSFHYFE